MEASHTAGNDPSTEDLEPESMSFPSSTGSDEDTVMGTITYWLLSFLRKHPYQNMLMAVIVARIIQLLLAYLVVWPSWKPQASNATPATREERLRHSRLLQDPPEMSPNTHSRNKETIIKQQGKEQVAASDSRDEEDHPSSTRVAGPATRTTPRPPSATGKEAAAGNHHPVTEDTSVQAKAQSNVQAIHSTCDNPWTEAAMTTSRTVSPTPQQTQDGSRGNLNAFYDWFDVEASLFRVYERGRADVNVVPPYNPTSRRGTVKVALQVVNRMLLTRITAYWVDYQGRLVNKGSFGPGQTWDQTTWVDHPWVFCNEQDTVLLHYVPYRIVPTTSQEPTVDPSNPACGMHRFRIKDASPRDSMFRCQVEDTVLPFPAADYFPSPEFAIDKVLLHCFRMNYQGWSTLLTYLSKIVQHADEPKYRRIRTANKHFAINIWMTPAKGLLLAVGFQERCGYAELAYPQALSRDKVQDIAQVVYLVEQWQRYAESGELPEQPEGADGFGRAGFGRAGQMNL